MIDGVDYAGETMVVAMGITEDGTKRVPGLRQGATENAAVCTELLEDLRERVPFHPRGHPPLFSSRPGRGNGKGEGETFDALNARGVTAAYAVADPTPHNAWGRGEQTPIEIP